MAILPPLLIKYIKDTQTQAIREKGFVPDPEKYAYASWKLWQELLKENDQGFEAVKEDLQDTERLMLEIGPFQNPVHLFGLVRYNREVSEVYRRVSGVSDKFFVPFASATLGSVNAVSTLIRQEFVTIYNDGLFTLVELMSAQMSFALAKLADGDPHESLGDAARAAFRADSVIVQSLLETITSYVLTGDPRKALARIPDSLLIRDGVHRLLRDTALKFVVAHELGHVYLLHHIRDTPSPETTEPSNVSHRWQSEYDADRFAAKLAIEEIHESRDSAKQGNMFLKLLAVEFQPMLAVLVSAAVDYIDVGAIPQREDGKGTHPPSDRRFANVRASVEALTRDSPMIRQDDLTLAQEFLNIIVWHLLPPLRDRCLELRRSGVRSV